MKKTEGMTDLTGGKILSQLVRFAIPVILTNLLQNFYGIADTFIVSRFIGMSGVSALTNAGQITYIITNMTIGLSLGGNIMISQYFGRKNKQSQDETTGSFLTLFAILGILFTVVFFVAGRASLTAMNTPPEVLEQAVAYLKTCSVGIFFVFGYNALASTLRAVGNSKKPFHCILAATVTNLALDIVFVGVLKMDTFGAALATVVGQIVAFVIALRYLYRQRDVFVFSLAALRLRWDKVRLILKIGIPTAVQWTVAGLSFVVVTYFLNGYGVVVSAANGLSARIRDVSMMYINSILSVTSAMIAQNLGAEKYDRARETMLTAMRLAFAGALLIVIVVEFAAPQLIALFGADEQVVAAGAKNLRIEIVGQLFYTVFFMLQALMTGAGHTMYVLMTSFINSMVFRIALCVALNFFFGLTGVYVALMLAPGTAIPICYAYYRRGRWRRTLAG